MSSSRISINGHLSKAYNVCRGLRQGDPLSCSLILLCLEPLIEQIQRSKVIKGININEVEIKVSAYADDLTVILDGTERSLKECVKMIDDFGQISGMSLNKAKTRPVWIGKDAMHKPPIARELALNWKTGPFELLGVIMSNDPKEDIRSLNYDKKVNEMQSRLTPWTTKGLTPFGKIYLIKSVVISSIVHLMTVLPKPSQEMIKKIESIMFKFIWNNKRDKVKRATLKAKYKNGGLKVPDIGSQADSLKISWAKKLLINENEAAWKHCAKKFIHHKSINILECNPSKDAMKRYIRSKFWIEVMTAWKRTQGEPESNNEVLEQCLWLNKDLGLENMTGKCSESLQRKGIIYAKDLYDNNSKRFLTPSAIRDKYRVHTMMALAIYQKIPQQWKIIMANHEGRNQRESVKEKLYSITRPAAWSYGLLLKTEITTNAVNRWAIELGEMSKGRWEKAFQAAYAATSDRRWRWLQLQILHRILLTNRLLFLYKISESSKCNQCETQEETITHVFWDCRKVRNFWHEMITPSTRSFVNRTSVIVGVKVKDVATNAFLMAAKKFIWHCRAQEINPGKTRFKSFAIKYLEIEKYIATVQGKISRFNKVWDTTLRFVREA